VRVLKTTTKSRLGSRRQPEASRAAILRAALSEFAQEGVSGARTDAIAHTAGVNKALLYYYFKDKESIYAAALDQVFGGLSLAIREALSRPLPPEEKILAYAGAHFDYIASNPLYPRIVQGEMMRAGRGGSTEVRRIMQQYFRPIFRGVERVLRAGIESEVFRPVEPLHFIPSMISVIVFYFNAAPILRLLTGNDPMLPVRVAERRAAVLDFISAALFVRTPRARRNPVRPRLAPPGRGRAAQRRKGIQK
jgi:TetR/AcrR family transcriptional regulator